MRLLRKLRGIATTALTWGLGWAVLGGIVFAGIELLWSSLPPAVGLSAPERAWGFFLIGFRLVGMLGMIAGALFATTVAFAERRHTLATLSGRRMSIWGALGGAAIPIVGATIYVAGEGAWPQGFLPFIAVSAALGALSSWTMLRLARRGGDSTPPSALSDGGQWQQSGRVEGTRVPRSAT